MTAGTGRTGLAQGAAALLLALAVWLRALPAAAAGETDHASLVGAALELACRAPAVEDMAQKAALLPGFGGFHVQPRAVSPTGWRVSFEVSGGVLTIRRLAPGGELRDVTAQFDGQGGRRPELLASADITCSIRTARRLVYGPDGDLQAIEHLDDLFAPVGWQEPVNPEVPRRRDPGGLAVALIDTGVNYLLPEIEARLARDVDDDLLGFDYWDLDRRPFDADPVESVFFPAHHGTGTASLVAREAPVAKLVPYRYPWPDMARLTDLVADAAAKHIRLVNISLADPEAANWRAFADAAARHTEILFIAAAGNLSRDLDREPMYPAALDLPNLITVTSAMASGRLYQHANWGRQTVDLMVPAFGLRVIDFDGGQRRVSGSSYAAARVSALAACLLAAHPEWTTARLRQAILARAVASADSGQVAVGFLPDPAVTDRGACRAMARVYGL